MFPPLIFGTYTHEPFKSALALPSSEWRYLEIRVEEFDERISQKSEFSFYFSAGFGLSARADVRFLF